MGKIRGEWGKYGRYQGGGHPTPYNGKHSKKRRASCDLCKKLPCVCKGIFSETKPTKHVVIIRKKQMKRLNREETVDDEIDLTEFIGKLKTKPVIDTKQRVSLVERHLAILNKAIYKHKTNNFLLDIRKRICRYKVGLSPKQMNTVKEIMKQEPIRLTQVNLNTHENQIRLDQISLIKSILEIKYNKFLYSMLNRLNNNINITLSEKQMNIVHTINNETHINKI